MALKAIIIMLERLLTVTQSQVIWLVWQRITVSTRLKLQEVFIVTFF